MTAAASDHCWHEVGAFRGDGCPGYLCCFCGFMAYATKENLPVTGHGRFVPWRDRINIVYHRPTGVCTMRQRAPDEAA